MTLRKLKGLTLYVEIRGRSLRVQHEEQTLVLPLERDSTGRLTRDCKERVSAKLQTALKKKGWQPRARALCAVEARGVSLRRLSLPTTSNGDPQNLLRLKIEAEFPLPPESLAWGYSRIHFETNSNTFQEQKERVAGRTNAHQEFTVAALRREILDDYLKVFNAAGLNPVFTVAALARSSACPQSAQSFAVLDIGRGQSELLSVRDGVAEALRVLPWGGDNITRAIAEGLGISSDEAEKLKLQSDEGPVPNGEVGKKIHAAIDQAVQGLGSIIKATWKGEKLYLTGRGARYREMPRRLTELLAIDCERIPTPANDGVTAAILGLQKSADTDNALLLRLNESRSGAVGGRVEEGPSRWLSFSARELHEIWAQPALKKWARLALLLCVCLVCFPFAEALLLKPILAKKLASLKADKGRLAMIDRELSFLQYLKQSQPPYLDALTVLANASPPGTRVDTVTMNRVGELSLKGNMQSAQQVLDLRSKLIRSGFFNSVSVEEQTPSPDRQRMTVHMVAQWKPTGSRPLVKPEPLPPGFSPGTGMPFPMMPAGPPIAFGPGPSPMPIPGTRPDRVSVRGPGGVPLPPGVEASRRTASLGVSTNAEAATNSTDSTKPAAAEEPKKGPE